MPANEDCLSTVAYLITVGRSCQLWSVSGMGSAESNIELHHGPAPLCSSIFFYAGKEVNALADYAFRSYEERQKIQEMVEAGLSAKDIAASLGISPSAVYAELRRGRDGTRLPDKRLGYNAELAQLSVQQGLERRGRRTAGA